MPLTPTKVSRAPPTPAKVIPGKVFRLSSPPSCGPKLLLRRRKVALLLLSPQKRSLCSTGTCSKSCLFYHTPKPRRSKNLFLSFAFDSCPSKFRRNSSAGLVLFLFLSFLCLFLKSLCPWAPGLLHEISKWPKWT